MLKVYSQRGFVRTAVTLFFATSNDGIHKGGSFSKSPSHREDPADSDMQMSIWRAQLWASLQGGIWQPIRFPSLRSQVKRQTGFTGSIEQAKVAYRGQKEGRAEEGPVVQSQREVTNRHLHARGRKEVLSSA